MKVDASAHARLNVWLLALAAVLVRIVVAGIGHGTNDAFIWQRFAEHIDAHGLAATYRALPRFNHPPLMGFLAQAVLVCWCDLS
jgi:hypothetical protein